MSTANISFQDRIRNRFQQGFNNWNNGYEAWLEWCETLYEPDAYYNVYGNRLTLKQYMDLMGEFFENHDIELGPLDNVLVNDDWGAVRYETYVTDKRTGEKTSMKTMEFVKFKDNPEPIGARVVEGWAISDSSIKP